MFSISVIKKITSLLNGSKPALIGLGVAFFMGVVVFGSKASAIAIEFELTGLMVDDLDFVGLKKDMILDKFMDLSEPETKMLKDFVLADRKLSDPRISSYYQYLTNVLLREEGVSVSKEWSDNLDMSVEGVKLRRVHSLSKPVFGHPRGFDLVFKNQFAKWEFPFSTTLDSLVFLVKYLEAGQEKSLVPGSYDQFVIITIEHLLEVGPELSAEAVADILNIIDFDHIMKNSDLFTNQILARLMSKLIRKQFERLSFRAPVLKHSLSLKHRVFLLEDREKFNLVRSKYVNALLKNQNLELSELYLQYKLGVLSFSDFEKIEWSTERLNKALKVKMNSRSGMEQIILAMSILDSAPGADKSLYKTIISGLVDISGRMKKTGDGATLKPKIGSSNYLDFDDYIFAKKAIFKKLAKAKLSDRLGKKLFDQPILRFRAMSPENYLELLWMQWDIVKDSLGADWLKEKLIREIRAGKVGQHRLMANVKYLASRWPEIKPKELTKLAFPKDFPKIESSKIVTKEAEMFWAKNDFLIAQIYLLFDHIEPGLINYFEAVFFNTYDSETLQKQDALDWLKRFRVASEPIEKELYRLLTSKNNMDPKELFTAYLVLFPKRSMRLAEIVNTFKDLPKSRNRIFEILVGVFSEHPEFVDQFEKNRLAEGQGFLLNRFSGKYLDELVRFKATQRSAGVSCGVVFR